MRPAQAATLVVADSLERGLSLDDGLERIPLPPPVLTSARQGDVRRLLLELRVDPEAAQLAAAWPRSLAPALRRLEALPAGAPVGLHVAQTALYVGFLALLQFVVSALLQARVLPVLGAMARDFGTGELFDVSRLIAVVVLLSLIPLGLWLFLGGVGWRRLPGWGRQLQRAKDASLAAALLESGAPEDVRTAFLSRAAWLSTRLDPVDLDVLAQRSAVEARAALQRFLSAARVAALGLMTLNALGVLLAVYVTLARFSWVGS